MKLMEEIGLVTPPLMEIHNKNEITKVINSLKPEDTC